MANKPVTFVSGSLVKVRIDGIDVAYALSVGFSVSKNIISTPILGEYGVVTLTSGIYNPVRGQLRILTLKPQNAIDQQINNALANRDISLDNTSPINANTSTPQTKVNDGAVNGVVGLNENLRNSFDPAKVLLSTTFDLEVLRAYPTADQSIVYNAMTLIKDCRIETRSGNIPLGQLVNETVSFTGTLLVNYSPNDPTGSTSDKILEDHYATDLVNPEA